jgi:hypothetical protein
MAWERRKRGGQYYTRSRRDGDRVVREYIGTGEAAEIVAELDQLDREMRAAQRQEERARQEELRQLETLVVSLGRQAQQFADAQLLAAGLHQHRGQWRRRRG